jgi:hypothetical protein
MLKPLNLIENKIKLCHPEERRIFFALLIADFYAEEDPSLRSG